MEQTLRSYEPTWRDRVAQWMLGDQRPTAGQRSFVSGLLGSSGTGSTGMGVVDATPIGGLLSAQENAQRGDYKGAALAALPMPVKAGANLVKRAAEEVVPAVERGIVAYHGSPHSFDRFDMSKIGTGEGAQAYGHGLYFAESEPTAKAYRDKLSAGTMAINGDTFNPYRDISNVNVSKALSNGGLQEGIATARQLLETAYHPNDPRYAGVKEDLDKLLFAEKGVVGPNSGSMYQVRINADPEHFLDWDTALSQQPDHVFDRLMAIPEYKSFVDGRIADAEASRAAAFEKYGYDPGGDTKLIDAYRNPTGSGAVKSIESIYQDKPSAAQALREAGIPGIKYLDQGSRGAGEGSRNYVVFDDSLIEILKKYGLVGLLGGGAAMNAPGQQQPEM